MCFRTVAACCRTKSATCICAVVVIHVVLIITLVAALFTRFYVYSDYAIGNMPTDTRLLLKAGSSIFCVRRIAKSFIMDGASSQRVRDSHEINSNTLPEFDLYTMSENPLTNPVPKVRAKYSMEGFSSLVPSGYDFNHFRFLNGSAIKIKMCSEQVSEIDKIRTPNDTNHGLIVFVVQGNAAFNSFARKLDRGEPICNRHEHGSCPLNFEVQPTNTSTCENPSAQTRYSTFETIVNSTAEYYVVIFNPNAQQDGQKYRIRYDLDRYEYDLTNMTVISKKTRSTKADPDLYLLLKFPYKRNSTYDKLYNIEVDYICEPNNMVYISIFFFVPLAFVIIFGVSLVCCVERYGSQTRNVAFVGVSPLVNQENGDLREDERGRVGYGSTDPIYT